MSYKMTNAQIYMFIKFECDGFQTRVATLISSDK